MKKIISLAIVVQAALAFAAGPGSALGKPRPDSILKPDTQKGKIVFVNAQKDENVTKWAGEHVSYIGEFLRITTEIKNGTFDLQKPDLQGDATVFIVDDEKLPMSLVACEAKWAMVNVNSLKTDKPVFHEARVKKMIIRVFSTLCGAACSQYPHSYTSSATKAEDVDTFATTEFVVDVAAKIPRYIEAFGVRQGLYYPYSRACKEGWAPAPTNDLQKATWNRVHELPTNPIKIEFDPKTDK